MVVVAGMLAAAMAASAAKSAGGSAHAIVRVWKDSSTSISMQ
jgi:hypothetical protein